MKSVKILLSIFLLISAFTSCKQDDLLTFDSESQIFFDFAYERYDMNKVVDSTFISFGYDKVFKADSTVSVLARVLGDIKDYDREFTYMIVDTSTTAKQGTNFEIMTSVIEAGKRNGNLNIKLYNTPDLNDTTYIVTVRLIENEHFQVTMQNYITQGYDDKFLPHVNPIQYKFSFNSKSEIPNLWADFPSRFGTYFGDYSNVKFDFMLDILHLEREFFMYDPEVDGTATQVWNIRFPGSLAYDYVRTLNQALDLYVENRLAGYDNPEKLPLLDENGEEVKMKSTYR